MRQEAFSSDVAERRHTLKMPLRDASKAAGISCATFSRVERRYPCDIATFEALCKWANLKPMKYLEVSP